ncbi:MAG: proline racemase family protein [Rhodospirillales bacterium]|jgi:trans-L-3-hydroxyproline dehydratase|nr:proline racemase family protein [Rhodospirillales bacterium]HJO73538.1 proline racemase family protein [Rhodospirillales bacterium]
MSDIVIETTEMHTGGEPVRIVTSGYPPIAGDTLLAKRRYVRENLEHLRRMLMFEPRGHHDMYGVIPVEPDHPEADIAVLFMHNEGYSTMCGHATLALGRWAVDTGAVEADGRNEVAVNIQCPCGLVRTRVAIENGKVGAVAFESVPAFAFVLDKVVDTRTWGPVTLDIGYGGAFYVFLAAPHIGLNVRESPVRDLVDAATEITEAAKVQVPLSHPEDDDLAYLYGTILTDGRDAFSDVPSANVCVFADAQVDRSATGSGVTARMALQLRRGLIEIGQTRRFESVTGDVFTGTAVRACKVGRFDALTVEVSGRPYYTGTACFTLEDGDALGGGFLLR